MDVYLVGFHPMEDSPDPQMEAHHFCRQVNQDFAQCTLFDSNSGNANLIGIDYIISEKLFETLSEDEREYRHPHNAEISQWSARGTGHPRSSREGLDEGQDEQLRQDVACLEHRSDGGQAGDKLPWGPPLLAGSFDREGEARPGLVEQRDKKMDIDTAEKRRQRSDLQSLARPQWGVDDLKAAFPQARPIPGVVDKKTAAPSAAASR